MKLSNDIYIYFYYKLMNYDKIIKIFIKNNNTKIELES